MRTLDRSKPFAEVFGSFDGHRFEQDGIKFGPDGKEVVTAKQAEPETEKIAVTEESAGDPGNGQPSDTVDDSQSDTEGDQDRSDADVSLFGTSDVESGKKKQGGK